MYKEKILRLNLVTVEHSLLRVEKNWKKIDDELDLKKIGRKDTTFTADTRSKMMCAYELLDHVLRKDMEPFSMDSFSHMCELNNMVHYGNDRALRREYHKAIEANSDKYSRHIGPIAEWYRDHMKKEPHPLKAAAEVYVAILGFPQLFTEGNHRAGSLIASWISMYYGHPPFVLTPENAIDFFKPSSDIKMFTDKTTWRGRRRLPQYRVEFKKFWEENIDWRYVL